MLVGLAQAQLSGQFSGGSDSSGSASVDGTNISPTSVTSTTVNVTSGYEVNGSPLASSDLSDGGSLVTLTGSQILSNKSLSSSFTMSGATSGNPTVSTQLIAGNGTLYLPVTTGILGASPNVASSGTFTSGNAVYVSGTGTVSDCSTLDQCLNFIGVAGGTAGSTAIVLTEGQTAVVNSNSSGTWTAGDIVCQDTTNLAKFVDNVAVPCDVGLAGIARGDAGAGTTHSVILTKSAPKNATFWWNLPSSSTAQTAPAQNVTKMWGFQLTNTIFDSTQMCVFIGAIDNTANVYDMGLYNAAGKLVAHWGAHAGSSLPGPGATGTKCISWSATTTIPAGKYYWAITSSAASPLIAPAGASNYANFATAVAPTSGDPTSGGALNATITPPADSWANGVLLNFSIH